MGESPINKIGVEAAGKENVAQTPASTISAVDVDLKKPVMETLNSEEKKPSVVPETKSLVANEPLLQENPNRFVLFPIKFHEVRLDASRVDGIRVN